MVNVLNKLKTESYLKASGLAMALAVPSTALGEGFLDNITIGANGSLVGIGEGNTVDQGNAIMNKLKDVLGVVRGVCLVVCVICLIYGAAQLAMSTGNPSKRAQAMDSIKYSLVGAGIMGGAFLLIQIGYSFLL